LCCLLNLGAPGKPGQSGPTGVTGGPGPQGPQGARGAVGDAGLNGEPGDQGPIGQPVSSNPILADVLNCLLLSVHGKIYYVLNSSLLSNGRLVSVGNAL